MKILIADDEAHILHAIQFLFAKRGHEVYVAEDGETALQLARSELPDLIFLDMNMPRKNGLEVCEAIRAEAGLRELPIYILTGQDQSLTSEEGEASPNVTAYLIKPVAPRDLLDILASHELSAGES
jgi:two-component system, OmpR family, alkaline phosphatase synthesis response regulator PhoP